MKNSKNYTTNNIHNRILVKTIKLDFYTMILNFILFFIVILIYFLISILKFNCEHSIILYINIIFIAVVLFGGYSISYKIKSISKSIDYLNELLRDRSKPYDIRCSI